MMRALLALVALGGCGKPDAPPARRARPTTPRAPQGPASGPASGQREAADSLGAIAAGVVRAGSPPGRPGRRPASEMDDVPIEIEEFGIERDIRPQRGLSQPQAAVICAADGRRLCTELEWEWACEGPAHADRAPARTNEGVRGLGLAREWTASPWGKNEVDRAGGFALRGARPDAPAASRRCAARQSSVPLPDDEGRSPEPEPLTDVAFRCCSGEPNRAEVSMEPPRPTFLPFSLDHERFAAIVRSVPELAEVHGNPTSFAQRDVDIARTRPASTGAPPGNWRLGTGPLLWTPERGDELLVLSGRSGPHGFVAALYRLPGDRFAHAASMILREDTTPLLVAWGALRREILWTPCWGCREVEGGKIVYRIETFDVRVTHY